MPKLSKFKNIVESSNKVLASKFKFVKNEDGQDDINSVQEKYLLEIAKADKIEDEIVIAQTSHGFVAMFYFKVPNHGNSPRADLKLLLAITKVPNFRYMGLDEHENSLDVAF